MSRSAAVDRRAAFRRDAHKEERALRSDEDLEAIVSQRLTGFGKWSSVVLAGGVATMLGICGLIRYRDLVVAPCVFSAGEPAARLVAPRSGYWRIQPSDGSPVQKGEVVALRETLVDASAVTRLERLLDDVDRRPEAMLAELRRIEGSSLGELLEPVESLVGALSRIERRRDGAAWAIRRSILEVDRDRQRAIMGREALQATLAEKAVELAREKRRRLERLVGEGIAAEGQLGDADLEILGREADKERAVGAVELCQLELRRLERSLSELNGDEQQEDDELRLALRDALSGLKMALDGWEEQQRLRSPRSGVAYFLSASSGRRFATEGEELLAVVGLGGTWQATASIEAADLATVRPGQDARLVFDADRGRRQREFPVRVEAVAKVPHEAKYLVRFGIPTARPTRPDVGIAPGTELTGVAEIVTEERSLLARLLGRLRAF